MLILKRKTTCERENNAKQATQTYLNKITLKNDNLNDYI